MLSQVLRSVFGRRDFALQVRRFKYQDSRWPCGRRDFALQGCCFKYADLSLTVSVFALQGCCFKYEDLLQELGRFGVRRDFALQGCCFNCYDFCVPVGILQCKVLAETNMTMQNPAFEVFPFEHGDFPMSCLYFVGVGFFVADRGFPLQGIFFNSENFYLVL